MSYIGVNCFAFAGQESENLLQKIYTESFSNDDYVRGQVDFFKSLAKRKIERRMGENFSEPSVPTLEEIYAEEPSAPTLEEINASAPKEEGKKNEWSALPYFALASVNALNCLEQSKNFTFSMLAGVISEINQISKRVYSFVQSGANNICSR